MDKQFWVIVQALMIISRQIQACEIKLNKLLAKQGEDAQIQQLTEVLSEQTQALQAAIASRAKQKQPTKGKPD